MTPAYFLQERKVEKNNFFLQEIMNQHEWGPEAGGPAETGRQQWSGWGPLCPQSRGPPPGGLPHFPQFSRLSGGSVLGRRPAMGLQGVWGRAGHPSGLSTWLAPEGSSGRQVGLLGWPGLVVGRAPSEGELSVVKSPRVSGRGCRPGSVCIPERESEMQIPGRRAC